MTLPKTTETVTIYATSWCPFCQSLISGLKQHEDLSSWVESVNDGNRIVPTVLYSDGTHATNPDVSAVEAKYSELTAK